MDLPENFVKRGLKMAKGSLLFGKSFADMTRDELIAAAVLGWEAERQLRESHIKERAEWCTPRSRDRNGPRA